MSNSHNWGLSPSLVLDLLGFPVVDGRSITASGELMNQGRSPDTKVQTGEVEVIPPTEGNPGQIIYKQLPVKKSNCDEVLVKIEYNVMNRLLENNIRVAKPLCYSGKEITIENVGDCSLKDNMLMLYLGSKLGIISPEDILQAYDLFHDAVEQMSSIDTLLDNGIALNKNEKKYLLLKQYKKIADTFKVSIEEAKKNFFAYRVMNALDIKDTEFINKYKPISEKLEKGLEEYGIWIGDEFTGNRMITRDNKTIAIDFNNITFNLMQINDALLLDTYPNMHIFDGKKVKELLEERVKVWNEKNPEKKITDFNDYFDMFCYASIHRCLLQFGHAVDEAKRIKKECKDYHHYGYSEKIVEEAKYYLELVYDTFCYLASEKKITEEQGKSLFNHIRKYAAEKVQKVQGLSEELMRDYGMLRS